MGNAPRIQVRQNRLTRRYRVVVLGRNHEPLTTSETLNTRAAAEANIRATIDAVRTVEHIDWPD
jgi:hypothetical protein